MRFDQMLHRVLPYAPNVPVPLAINALRDASIEWCRGTLCHQRWFTLTPAASVIVPFGDGETLVRITAVKDRVVRPASALEEADGPVIVYDGQTPTGHQFLFNEPPAVDVMVRMALRPSEDAVSLSDSVYSEFAKDVADGAIAVLLTMPEVDWTNEGTGSYHRARFEDRMNTIAAKVTTAWAGAPVKIKPSFF